MTVRILRTDGRDETHELPRAQVWEAIERLLDAPMLDSVNLRDGRVMFVDDAGYETETIEHGPGPAVIGGVELAAGSRIENRPVRARKPVNPQATALYHAVCVPGTTHQIVGDVAIVWDADFED